MKYRLITLLLLALAVAGCVVEPYGGHGRYGGDNDRGDHGRGDHGPGVWGR